MTDLTDSQQNTYGATLVVGLRDGNQTISASDYTKYRQFFYTGAAVAGRIVTLPAVAGLKNHTGDQNNGYPVTVKRGTAEITVDPAQIKTLESDGTANGLSDETGSPALAGFSDEVPLPDSGEGDPGASVFPARADHRHAAAKPISGDHTALSGERLDLVEIDSDVTVTLPADPDDYADVYFTNQDGSLDGHTLTVIGKAGSVGFPIGAPQTGYTDNVTATSAYIVFGVRFLDQKWSRI